MFEWINKHKIRIIIFILILIISVPFIIHCLFKIKTNHLFWVSTWSAGDFLVYYGSVLSFCATGILSFLALWQNEIIRRESNKHTKLLEEMEKNKCCPYFNISFVKEKVNHSNIEISIQNVSENIAIDMELFEVNGTLKRKGTFYEHLGLLAPQGVLTVYLENDFLETKDVIEMLIQCKDMYGNLRLYNVRGEYNIESRKYFFAVYKQAELAPNFAR